MNVEQVVQRIESSRSIDLASFKKSDLLALCVHYRIDYVKSSFRKHEIARGLCEYLLDENVIDQLPEGLEQPQEILQLTLKRMELEHEARIKDMELHYSHRMKELEQKEVKPSSPKVFDVAKNVRLVPQFSETEVDKFFHHFEKVATACKWPAEAWPILLQTALVGKGQDAFASLSEKDSADYEQVKASILKAYELVPEAYRLKFRNLRKTSDQTYVDFAREKRLKFDSWRQSRSVTTYDALCEMVKIAECFPADLRSAEVHRAVGDLVPS